MSAKPMPPNRLPRSPEAVRSQDAAAPQAPPRQQPPGGDQVSPRAKPAAAAAAGEDAHSCATGNLELLASAVNFCAAR